MSNLSHALLSSNRAVRDRIEATLAGLPWFERGVVVDGLTPGGVSGRRCAAGVLRKAFAPELARMRDVEDTLARVRKVARQYPEDGDIPVRRILAALYGEEL
ncbi:hypothetical protein [Streptomyces sp. NPDC051554]|uniref:hypothetical protein n=1 Tax=Streptomyces sp. NPDC051554 TaxID=3365656 RepID=UPI00379E9CDD